jgi:hypothetical protein
MYAYNFLHDPLLCSLTQLFSQILQNPSGGEVKWQVRYSLHNYIGFFHLLEKKQAYLNSSPSVI